MSKTDPPKGPDSRAPDTGPSASDPDEPPRALPKMDFSMFLMSLGSTAMVNLGQVPAPDSDTVEANLPAAKQIIDILGVLEEKTRGNLDDSETKLLTSLLYDLRVHYVDACQGKK